MPKEVEVAIGILAEKDAHGWRVLITRRLDTAIYGGWWELPGGKIEPGETPAQCVTREFAEEVGLAVEVGRELPLVEHTYEHGHVRLHPFFCRRLAGAGKARNLHVAEHRWVRPEDLKDFKFLPANAELMETVRTTLTQPDARID